MDGRLAGAVRGGDGRGVGDRARGGRDDEAAGGQRGRGRRQPAGQGGAS